MPMTMDMFVFLVLALVAVASAFGMLISRNGNLRGAVSWC